MYRRLNITLPDDVVARADEFARRERYTRSALIAAALNAFVDRDPRLADLAQKARDDVQGHGDVGLNPAVRSIAPAIMKACRKAGVTYAALVGWSTRPDPAVTPRKLELLARFDAEHEHVRFRLALQTELEILSNMPVELILIDTVGDEGRRQAFERTMVVLYEDGRPDAESPDPGGFDMGHADA
jgi:predicted transcriptional regulator